MASRIDDLLRMAMSFGASDLHLRAGSFPVIRVNGELRPLSGVTRMTQDETLEMAFSMMSNRQKQHFKEVYEVDIGYGVSVSAGTIAKILASDAPISRACFPPIIHLYSPSALSRKFSHSIEISPPAIA